MRPSRDPFLVLWTLAVVAATAAFVVNLSARARTLELGYELGASHSRLGRLREVKRVFELERASQETPERVDLVGRTLFGMSSPEAERMLSGGPMPTVAEEVGAEAEPQFPPDPSAEAAPPR